MRAPLSLAGMFLPQNSMQPTPIAFNERSEELLAGVNPMLAQLLRNVEAKMPDAFEISEGMRNAERQAQLVAEGKSQTMNSKHLTGDAVDIHVVGPDGKPNWDFEAYRPIADAAKAEAAALGIPNFVWGGDWKTLKDGVHFQIGGPSGGTPAGAGGQGLSFGEAVGDAAPLTDPMTQGLLGLYSGMGPLAMGAPAAMPQTYAAKRQEEQRSDRRSAEQDRRIALADLMRY